MKNSKQKKQAHATAYWKENLRYL